MKNVAVVGVGQSRFGRDMEHQLAELAWIAIKEALDDAGVDKRDIGFMAVGNIGGWSAETLPAVVIGEYAGLTPAGSMRVEAACATGSAAFRVAYLSVASGMTDVALAVGVERMNESTVPQVVELIGRAGNFFWEYEHFGLTFPGYYALYATAYLQEYGATEEDLAKVAVKNHYYGARNPKAQFQREITVEEVMKSRYVAWPLKLYDCSPITDGAAAAVLTSEEVARKLTDTPVWVKAQGTSMGTGNLSRREDFLSLYTAVEAREEAYKRAGIDRDNPAKQFDVALVHDCFTIAEILAYEDLGFAKRGEGYRLIRDEQTYIGGLIPVNVDGGLKAKGHPIGATGLSMVGEAVKQLQQRADKGRQVDVKLGRALLHNVGGTGHYAYVTVLSLDKR